MPHTSKRFTLNQFLHDIAISKKFLSVFKFSEDNFLFFEFHANHCLVKKKATKGIFLHGKVKDGLYVFQKFIPTCLFYANTSLVKPQSSSYTLWNTHFWTC